MTCFLRMIGGRWYAAFALFGKQQTASLKTRDRREAEIRIAPIRDALYRLEMGTLEVPPGVDPREFVLAGGRAPNRDAESTATLADLRRDYLAGKTDVEPNSRRTIGIHLAHAVRILGGGTRLDALTIVDAERYAAARLGERGDRPIKGYTVRKELRTIHRALAWAAERRTAPPPGWTVKGIALPKDRAREPFRTFGQIAELLASGAIDADAAWETLYLSSADLEDVLDHVQATAAEPWIYPMVAFVALTGARRSEMLRSRAEDWDLKAGVVRVREKKRDAAVDLTFREIDVHPRLAEAWREWGEARPKSSYAVTIDGGRLDPDRASDALARTLRPHPKWSKIRGFHTFRHSVASILASEGVDQRYIDKVLGHQTEAMRKRYQHLFPRGVSRAISILLPPPTGAEAPDSDSGSTRRR